MRPPAGDGGTGYGGLPKPPAVARQGWNGLLDTMSWVIYLVNETIPALAIRQAFNVDRRRWVGRRIP